MRKKQVRLTPECSGSYLVYRAVKNSTCAPASLLVKLCNEAKGVPYVIDPMTYAFGSYVDPETGQSRTDLDWIKSDQNPHQEQPKGDHATAMLENKLERHSVRIGFIGLGLMGSRLARRLHTSGWRIQAWNRSPKPAEALRLDGVAIATSVANLVVESDVILSSLANDAAAHAIYFDDQGVFSAVRPGTIVLEMSTISPELSRRLHAEAVNRGVRFLDLAISGSPPAVEAGTVTLLAGGDRGTFNECTPLFESIAKQWFLIGPGSSGIKMKLVVNLMLGVTMEAIAEAISLGDHLQIDRNVLLDVLSQTAVIPPAHKGKFQKIKNHDYSPEFPLRLMSKDMNLVLDTAVALGAELPAAKAAQTVFASNVPTSGDLDLSAITPFIVN